MRGRICAAVLVLCVLVPPTLAKGPKDLGDWRNLHGLDADVQIVVTTTTGAKLVGFARKVTDDAITIDIEAASPVATGGRIGFGRTIPRVEVREVRKAKGSRVVSALAGAAIGAGAGAAIGAGVESRSRSDEDRGLLTAVTTLLGGMIGGAVGHKNPFKGPKIYVAP